MMDTNLKGNQENWCKVDLQAMDGYLVQAVIQEGKDFLHKAWIGYKRALNPRNGESFQDKSRWAATIQKIQSDL
jgi:hypothetical protein